MQNNRTTTQNSRLINASAEAIYKVFTSPKALEAWLAPGEMIGKVHSFDLRVGGGYQMSLYYPLSDGFTELFSYGFFEADD